MSMQEREAINAMFSGFDYDDEDEATEQVNLDDGTSIDGKAVNVLPSSGLNLKEYLAELEVSLIKQALDKNDWVVARSAELLDMRRTTLVEKMRKYNLQKPS